MQQLSPNASDRLNEFYEYMENTTKTSLDDISGKLAERINRIKSVNFDEFRTNYRDVLDEIENRDKELSRNIRESISGLINTRDAVVQAEADKTPCSEEGIDVELVKLEGFREVIESEIEEFRKNSDPVGLEKLKTELMELKAKKQFAKNQKAITAYLESLRTLSLYENVAISLNPRSITDKGTDLVGRALTPQLITALSNELGLLGASYVPLNLEYFGSTGRNLHQMKIDGAASTTSIKLTEILSEGEQRVIAIAGFLAELSLQSNPGPIVFDDPVSSLDHKFSEKIAARLVQESTNRQVVVFTHDISFLLDLQGKSQSQREYCHCINVHREGEVTGVIRGDEPWHAMPVHRRLHFIDQEVTQITSLFVDDQQEYNKQAGILYGYLRETWEAAIEECLFNKAIRRFQAEIKTRSLREVSFGKSDYDRIEKGMTKCSKWMIGHDLTKKISDNRPVPYELQDDIKKLREFVNAIKTKRNVPNIQQIAIPEIG